MRLTILSVALVMGMIPAFGQTTPAPTPQNQPQLSTIEKLALQALQDEFDQASNLQKKASRDLSEFQKQIAIEHPGYTFDPQMGLTPVKPRPVETKETKEPKETKPEKK